MAPIELQLNPHLDRATSRLDCCNEGRDAVSHHCGCFIVQCCAIYEIDWSVSSLDSLKYYLFRASRRISFSDASCQRLERDTNLIDPIELSGQVGRSLA